MADWCPDCGKPFATEEEFDRDPEPIVCGMGPAMAGSTYHYDGYALGLCRVATIARLRAQLGRCEGCHDARVLLEVERHEHDGTRGYRQHAEQERDLLRAQLAAALKTVEAAEETREHYDSLAEAAQRLLEEVSRAGLIDGFSSLRTAWKDTQAALIYKRHADAARAELARVMGVEKLRAQLTSALKTVEAADRMHASIKPASPRGLDGEIEGYEEARSELARVMGADGGGAT